jgi:hypothetical protein
VQHQLIPVRQEQHLNHLLNHPHQIHYDLPLKKMTNINEVFLHHLSKISFLLIILIKSFSLRRFCQDDDLCPLPCSSSSSSSLSDGELLDNGLGGAASTTATGQFLWIDHHPRRHSFANDSHLIDKNNFHYHPSSPFADHPPSIEDLRARFASAYILTTAPLTTIHTEDELSFQHETSIIDEGSMDLNEQHCSATSWAVSFEKLLNDQMGLHVFTEFLKKEFSQENIQFWMECEKLKALTDPDEVNNLLISFTSIKKILFFRFIIKLIQFGPRISMIQLMVHVESISIIEHDKNAKKFY